MERFSDGEMEAQQPYAYWLDGTEKISGAVKRKLLSLFGSPEEVCLARKGWRLF